MVCPVVEWDSGTLAVKKVAFQCILAKMSVVLGNPSRDWGRTKAEHWFCSSSEHPASRSNNDRNQASVTISAPRKLAVHLYWMWRRSRLGSKRWLGRTECLTPNDLQQAQGWSGKPQPERNG